MGFQRAAFSALLALACWPVAGASTEEPPAPVDVAFVIQEAKRVQFSDMAAWSRFRFRRQVEEERLGQDGRILETSSLEFAISPAGGGFDELLVRVDGRGPTPKEVAQHRRQGRFSRHYAAVRSGGGEGGEGGYSLGRLLHLSGYRYAGQETVHGVACHRLDFFPDERRSLRGIEGKIAEAMAGSLWITVEGHHVAKATARTVRPVSVALSIAKLRDLEINMEAVEVAGDVWVPGRIEVRADARVSWISIRKNTRYLYSGFELAHEGAPAGGGLETISFTAPGR